MYLYTKHLSCFSRHISTMTYSQMKRSRLRRDEDSVPANTRAKDPRDRCVLYNVHGETETTVTVGASERERASSLSFPYVLSPPPLLHNALLLSFFPSDVLHPPPPISSSPPPSLGRLIFSPASFRLFLATESEREREREEISAYTRTRNKKVIGSRYKGKFLRGSLNGNSDFSMVLISR